MTSTSTEPPAPPASGDSTGSSGVRPDFDRMPLVEHFRELRRRTLLSVLAVVVGVIVCFVLFEPIFEFIRRPYCNLPLATREGGDECNLVTLGVLDPFYLHLRVALVAGVVVAAPVWLYHFWAFMAPALHRRERRWALVFVLASIVLFILGAALAYLTLSKGLEILLGFAGDGIVPLLEVTRYLNYVVAMLLVFGVSFEFPLLVILLNVTGIVSARKLRDLRRTAVFLLFVFAAVVTPSQDPFTMLALALPMWLFFEAAVVFARLNDRRRARKAAALGLDDLPPDAPTPAEALRPDPVAPASPVSPVDDLAPGPDDDISAHLAAMERASRRSD